MLRKNHDNFSFERNVFGDEINALNARSIWRRGTKVVKSPALFEGDKSVLSFDAERTRLVEPDASGHWAIGSVVMRPNRQIVDEFSGMIDPTGLRVSKFVREKVIPHVDLPMYESSTGLLNAFWDFLTKHGGTDRVQIVADFWHTGRKQFANCGTSTRFRRKRVRRSLFTG